MREYEPYIVAETVVDSNFEDAGNRGFRRLFGYISGKNKSRIKIEMTSPVLQAEKGERIAMTAPVAQQRSQDKWVISFVIPGTYTMETIPTPSDARVKLRHVPAGRVATVRYSGFWSKKTTCLTSKSWI